MRPLLTKVLGIWKKIFLVLAVYFIATNLFFYFFQRDIPKTGGHMMQTMQQDLYKTTKNPWFQKSKENKAILSLYTSTVCRAIGELCTAKPEASSKHFNQSLIGGMAGLITYPYMNPPASGTYWAYESLQNAGFIPQTLAAEGIGFASLKPLSVIWKVFRDVAYLLLVLVIITIGFMVMFRTKVNQQTVVTLENSLPRIVMALVFITFSFPIAGFMIDLMYVSIVIGIAILSKADPSLALVQTQNNYIAGSMGQVWDGMFPASDGWSRIPLIGGVATLVSLGNAIAGVLPAWINDSVRMLALVTGVPLMIRMGADLVLEKTPDLLNNIDILGNGLGRMPGGALGTIIRILLLVLLVPWVLIHGAGYILGIVIFFTILFLLFRIFFLLLTSYLKILLLVILSPIILILEAVPGRKAFTQWIRRLAAELSSFPLIILLLVLGRILVNLPQSAGNEIWKPPFLHNIQTKDFAVLIGMGLIFIIPELVKTAKEKISGSKGLPFSVGLGTFFGGVGAGAGASTAILQKYYYAAPVREWLKKRISKDKPAKDVEETVTGTGTSGTGHP